MIAKLFVRLRKSQVAAGRAQRDGGVGAGAGRRGAGGGAHEALAVRFEEVEVHFMTPAALLRCHVRPVCQR